MANDDKQKLYPAYEGNEQYMFVSYAHADSDMVFPEIARFQNQKYNVWYDEGISPGNEWPEEIAKALENCFLFVVFITPNAVKSKNVRNEIYYALHKKIPFIAIHLLETDLEGGLELSLQSMQAILKYNMLEDEYVSKYTKSFKNYGFNPSTGESNKSPRKYVSMKNNKKKGGILEDLKLTLFYWVDKSNNTVRFSKTKTISIVVFVLSYLWVLPDLIADFGISSAIFNALFSAAYLTAPVFIIGVIIHFLIKFKK